ncbi:MGMT family protein [Halorussus halobius]|uniref:MGMT family protein n=1 Tax=Halorussus halobius TaxID=1710537 RepID=UPI0010929CA9|nr:MGMT family protein [Halorussus halobius]
MDETGGDGDGDAPDTATDEAAPVGADELDGDGVTGIFARESSYLDRYVQFGLASGRVLSVSFPETPDEEARPDHDLLDRAFDYLDGVTSEEFDDVAVALTVPTDQRRVLDGVREIPYGDEIDVETLARMTSGLDHADDEDLNAVRAALAENPAPLVIPDHRVRDGPSAAPPGVEQKLRSLEGL